MRSSIPARTVIRWHPTPTKVARWWISRYVLRDYFEQRPPAFVGIDLIVYYVKDKPQYSVAPDVFVTLGVDGGHRDTYKIWEERKVPDFVMEMASTWTAVRDAGRKKDLYHRLGVEEYCMYDP